MSHLRASGQTGRVVAARALDGPRKAPEAGDASFVALHNIAIRASDAYPAPAAKVLVIEDDPETRRMLEGTLDAAGFATEVSTSLIEAVPWIEERWAELVIMNARLGGRDCRPFFDWLVTRQPAPVVVIGPTADGFTQGRYLERGAADFVRTPVAPAELIARTRSAVRASHIDGGFAVADAFRAGSLTLDRQSHRVRVREQWVTLTGREFGLIDFLASHPRQAFRRSELLERVWGYTVGDLSTVTVHVRRLREKLEADPARPELIVTVWGVGYRFGDGGDPASDPEIREAIYGRI